jgi:hypothetical protein
LLSPEKKIAVERVMQAFFQKLSAVHDKDPEWTARFRAGDESALEDLVASACEDCNFKYDEYMRAVDSEPSLHALQKTKLAEVLLGSAVKNG